MKLLSPRLRIVLMLVIWLVSIGALLLWLSGNRLTRVTIAGGPAGSETLVLTTAIADALNQADLGLVVAVFETGGSAENIKLMEEGRIDLGTMQADMSVSDVIQGVSVLYSDAYHLIAKDESGIHHFADLPGFRLAIPPKTSGQYNSFWFLAGHYGLKPANLDALPMSESAANFAMEQGQVDAVFRVRAPGNEVIRHLIGDKKLRLVPLEQSEALALTQPAISPGVIPLGSYRGYPALPRKDMPTAVVDRLLVARSDLPASLIYKLTQAIYEYRSEVLESTKLAGFIAPLPGEEDSVLPVHPGAQAYFDREKPGFMQQNARLVSAGLYVVAILSSALLGMRTYWVRTRRLRMHTFNRRLMEIAGSAGEEGKLDKLLLCKRQLIDILTEVVADLENEKVSQEEFEHFSFTWQAVDALVRDRMNFCAGNAVVAAPGGNAVAALNSGAASGEPGIEVVK